MIRCQICKELLKNITWSHLWYKHGITTKEYKKKYSVEHLQCKSLRKIVGDRTRGKKYTLGHTYKMSEKNKEEARIRALECAQSKMGREKARIRMNKMYEDGTLVPGTGVRCKMYPIMNYVLGKEVKVRGKPELRFAELLNKLRIRWIIPKYKTYMLNGKEHKYFCDFWLPDEKLYVEVKSRYYYNLHKEEVLAKKRMMVEKGKRKGFKYKIMFEKDIKFLELLGQKK